MDGQKLNRNSPPLISVIIPFFNAEECLVCALDSIARQSYQNLQVILVDDGSTDSSQNIIKNYIQKTQQIKLAKRSGPAAARNAGLRVAEGDFIAFLDADDYWTDRHLVHSVKYLLSNSTVDIIKNLTQPFHEDQNKCKVFGEKEFFPFLLGPSLYRRKVFDIVGNFNSELTHGSDADFYLRTIEAGTAMQQTDQLSLFYRRHHTSLTANKKEAIKGRIAFLKRKIIREKEGSDI